MRPPAIAYSDTLSFDALDATTPRIGAWPTVMAIGQGLPLAHYLRRMTSPCLPGSMKTDSVVLVVHLTR